MPAAIGLPIEAQEGPAPKATSPKAKHPEHILNICDGYMATEATSPRPFSIYSWLPDQTPTNPEPQPGRSWRYIVHDAACCGSQTFVGVTGLTGEKEDIEEMEAEKFKRTVSRQGGGG